MQRLTILFSKSGSARFLSHLDLQATLEFSIRRARLPVALSEGFNPRPKMSLAAALPLGHIGEREILELTLRDPVPAAELGVRLSDALPAGIEVVSVVDTPLDAKPAGSMIAGAVYRVELPAAVDDLAERLEALLRRDSITVEEQREEKTRIRDLRPLIRSLEAVDDRTIRIGLRFQDGGTARPEQILELLDVPLEGAALVRERIELREP